MSQQQAHPGSPGVPLAATAEWIAAVRASETRRPDRILDGAGAKPRCARRAVGVDLTGRWTTALLDAGFDPRAVSCWLAEGSCSTCPWNGSPASWTR